LGAPLFAAGYVVSTIALWLALDGYWQAPAAGGAHRLSIPAILGFAAVLATLSASSVARRTGFFLYPVVWLALIPIGSTAVDVREWLGRAPRDADAALLLAGVSFVYLALAWLGINRLRLEYRWPWHLGGYALSAIAPLVAVTDTTIRPMVLGLSIGLYVASAIIARRSAWLYPVAVLVPVLLWQALGALALF